MLVRLGFSPVDVRKLITSARTLNPGQRSRIDMEGVGQRLPQLLNNPVSGWMTGDIEVRNPSATVFDHEEAVEQSKRYGGDGKEVERNGDFPVILKKRKPLLPRIAATAYSSQVTRHSPFGDDKAQLLIFAVDPRCSPR